MYLHQSWLIKWTPQIDNQHTSCLKKQFTFPLSKYKVIVLWVFRHLGINCSLVTAYGVIGRRHNVTPSLSCASTQNDPSNGLAPVRPLLNTLRPRQNGCHFADDIFKCIFLNEIVRIPIEISLKFVPQGPINNIPALVQIMAWRRPGDKPLSGQMMVKLPTHICVTRPRWVKPILIDYQLNSREKTSMKFEIKFKQKNEFCKFRLQNVWHFDKASMC